MPNLNTGAPSARKQTNGICRAIQVPVFEISSRKCLGMKRPRTKYIFLVCKMTVFVNGNTQIRRMLLLMHQNLPLREPLYDAILTLRVYTILDMPHDKNQWIWKVPSVFGSPECFVSHDIAYVVLAAMDQHHNDVAIQVLGLETLNALW